MWHNNIVDFCKALLYTLEFQPQASCLWQLETIQRHICAAVRLYNSILVRLICAFIQDFSTRNKKEGNLNFVFYITHKAGHFLPRSECPNALFIIVFGLLHRCLVAFCDFSLDGGRAIIRAIPTQSVLHSLIAYYIALFITNFEQDLAVPVGVT